MVLFVAAMPIVAFFLLFFMLQHQSLKRYLSCLSPRNDGTLGARVALWDVRRCLYSAPVQRRSWYRTSATELQNNPDLYVFKGVCTDELATLKVTTTVPVDKSSTKIGVKVNAPVTASFTRDIQGYTFDLPYLFRGKDQDDRTVFGFEPRRESDKYLTHITSHWECKAAGEEYLTYQFLICRVTLFGHDPIDIKPDMRDKPSTSYGAVAYSILSNGKGIR
jgi:hypothetical protein